MHVDRIASLARALLTGRRMEIRSGSWTERYRPMLVLGRGGMGIVYLARAEADVGVARLAVVKRMRPELRKNAWAASRFVDEARIAGLLHHTNVLGVERLGEDDEGYFHVLPYVEGACLDEIVERASSPDALPIDVAMRVASDLFAGLRATHAAVDPTGAPLEIVHGDVSCENVLVGNDGVARLIDFGAAQAGFLANAPARDLFVGKPLYTPPEVLDGAAPDRGADIYGAGVTAWIALAGREPWPDDGDRSTSLRARRGLPDLRSARPEVPDAVARVVMAAIAPRRERRFADVAELDDAFAEASVGKAADAGVVATLVDRLFGVDIERRRRRAGALDDEPLAPPRSDVRAVPAPANDVSFARGDAAPTLRCALR